MQGSQVSSRADIRSNNTGVSEIRSEISFGGAESVPEVDPEVNLKNNPPLTLESLHQQQQYPENEGSKVNRFLERLESESADSYDTPLGIDITETDDIYSIEGAEKTTKDEALARLEKILLDERTERLAEIERERAEKAAREQQLPHDRKIAEEAAALARGDAEKRVMEEVAKAKDEAETAAKKPPPEKKKPIKFKDALGRTFRFPFELCRTWEVGMLRFRRYLIDTLE